MEIPEESIAEAKQVVIHLALGLLRQDDAIRKSLARPVTGLDEQLQWGWDKLATFCYQYHVSPPRHLPEFVAWLHQPIESWEGIGHLFASALLSGPLLSYGTPSEFCADLGRGLYLSTNPEREIQDTPFKEILDYCKDNHLVEQYRDARQFLVTHPYLPYGGHHHPTTCAMS